jgi:MFS family permease
MTGQNQYIPFVISRLLAGIFSTTSLTLGAGILLDIFFLHQRGKAFAFYTITALLGPLIGPITSGFIAENANWTVQFWWCVGAMALVAVLVFLFLEDTTYDRNNSASNISPRAFAANRIATFFPGNKVIQQAKRTSFLAMYKIALCPVTILAGCALLVTFGWAVGVNTTLAVFLQTPEVAGGYGFTPSQNAWFVFTQVVSFIVAELYGYLLNDRLALWICKRRGGAWKPEYRLYPVLIPPMIALPVGLILFGVALQYHLHYMVLATGLFLATFADMVVVPIVNNYLAENFRDYAVETFTIMWVYRLTLGIALPFFIIEWVQLNGSGWVFGTMAILSTLGMSLLLILAWKGHEIRKYSFQSLVGTEEGEKIVEDAPPRGAAGI